MLPLFQQRKFPFLCLSCFRNIQPVNTILAPEDEYCFLLLLLQAIVIVMGLALNIAKAKSVIVFVIMLFSWGIIVFVIILFSWGIEGDSWLMT